MRRVASDSEQVEVITETFRLLGDPTRFRILLACLIEPRPVNGLAAEVGITPSLTSHHLRLLRAARLVRSSRRGRQIYYMAADEHVNGMLAEMIAHIQEAPPEDD